MELTTAGLNQAELIALLVVGILLLVFGYRIKKAAFFVAWFVVGFMAMTHLMPIINENIPQIVGNDLWQNLLPIAGGLLLSLLGLTIEKICLAMLIFGLTIMVTIQYFGTDIQIIAIGAIVGVILGALSIKLMKPAIIIATSVAGAYAVTVALPHFVTAIDFNTYYFPILIGTTVFGSIIQFLTTKHT